MAKLKCSHCLKKFEGSKFQENRWKKSLTVFCCEDCREKAEIIRRKLRYQREKGPLTDEQRTVNCACCQKEITLHNRNKRKAADGLAVLCSEKCMTEYYRANAKKNIQLSQLIRRVECV